MKADIVADDLVRKTLYRPETLGMVQKVVKLWKYDSSTFTKDQSRRESSLTSATEVTPAEDTTPDPSEVCVAITPPC